MSKLGIPTDGGPDGVTVLKQGFNVDPLLQKQAACISTMTYNEYWQVIDAGLKPEDLTVFKYEDEGVATLEDGLYVLEDKLADPAFVDTMAKFVRACMKGWKWAEENPDDAAMIVLDNDETGAQTEEHQKRMMGEIAKLTAGSNGALDPADYERTVKTLLSAGSEPVITKEPEGAWSHAVTDKALAELRPAAGPCAARRSRPGAAMSANANLFARLAGGFPADRGRVFLETEGGVAVSFADLLERAGRIAALLAASGVVPGDRVAVQVEKSVGNICLYLAVLQVGAVYVPLNTGYTAAELAYFLGDAEPKVVVCDPAAP